MRVTYEIDDKYLDEELIVRDPKLTAQMREVADYLERLESPNYFLVRKEGEVYRRPIAEIYRIFIEDRKIYLETKEKRFQTSKRLYQLVEDLPANFLQMSQSEVINIHCLDHLSACPNGMVGLTLTMGRKHTHRVAI